MEKMFMFSLLWFINVIIWRNDRNMYVVEVDEMFVDAPDTEPSTDVYTYNVSDWTIGQIVDDICAEYTQHPNDYDFASDQPSGGVQGESIVPPIARTQRTRGGEHG